ncbi:BNR repeat-containing protein [Granulosicoccus sp. 3-233]|uniref:BNR repeat-containing protein n=1 Tax=Granulosicoccus sp. 3-233 TaxID=3417969 RepID=UPI003D33C2F5
MSHSTKRQATIESRLWKSRSRRAFFHHALWLGSCLSSLLLAACNPQDTMDESALESPIHLSQVADGWAQNAVNAVIFRKNSLVTQEQQQYIAFYSGSGEVMLGRRTLGTDDWEISASGYSGRPEDAHNSISIMLDGAGYLHMAWDHHVDSLRYVRSTSPGSLQLGPMSTMTGQDEQAVTYPEFHRLPSGDLLFAYRDGRSGQGRMILNRYDQQSMQWTRLQDNLLDGQGERNAYWQMHVDASGSIHLSWVWRESSDVATNHDMHYARSDDGGVNWVDSSDQVYQLPISQDNAEIIWSIAEGSNLINQTSMTTDQSGTPYIATYFRSSADAATQVQMLYAETRGSSNTGKRRWFRQEVSKRQGDFSLSGGGSKSLPISRPQILAQNDGDEQWLHLIYRDSEFGDRAILASSNLTRNTNWHYTAITSDSLNRWEPSFDTELWRTHSLLHLYVQAVGQIDGEGLDESLLPSSVQVLELQLPLITQLP